MLGKNIFIIKCKCTRTLPVNHADGARKTITDLTTTKCTVEMTTVSRTDLLSVRKDLVRC